MSYEKALANVIDIEKGYVNNPADNGGPTNFGCTQNLARKHGYLGDMRDITLERVQDIFKKEFWDPLRCDELPFPLAEFLFDFAVNSGTPTAAKALQKAVGALPDGAVGPKTMLLVGKHTPRHILRLVFVARAKLFARHEDFETFGNGWFARLFDVTVRAMDEGAQ